MPTILHLVDVDGGGVGILSPCAMAQRLPGFHHEIWTIGSSPNRLRARIEGIAPDAELSALRSAGEFAWRAGIALKSGLLRRLGEPALAVCWSVPALSLARLVFGRALPRLGVVTEEPRPVSRMGDLRRRFALEDSTILAIGETTARAWRAIGAADVRSADPHAAPAPTTLAARRLARQAMNIQDDQAVIALLADWPALCNARRFSFIIGLLYTTGSRVTAIIPASAGQARRAARFTRGQGRRWTEVVWEGDTGTLLDACDIAMCDALGRSTTDTRSAPTVPSAGAQTLALACARGVPVVAPSHALSDELRAAGWPITLAQSGTQIDLAAAMLPLAISATGGNARTAGTPAVRIPSPGPLSLPAVLSGLYSELAARAPGASLPAQPFLVGAS